MRHLFKNWQEIKEQISANAVMLFLDFDGTLAPIARTPDKAELPRATRNLLGEIVKKSNLKFSIISGRSLNSLKDKIGISGIIYSGNHGLEIEGPKIKFKVLLSAGDKSMLTDIKNILLTRLKRFKGILLEDKALSLSLHYRLVEKKYRSQVISAFNKALISCKAGKKIRIKHGKMVFEIRPNIDWDKGKVALWLFARQKFALKGKRIIPVYIGDDLTDEDAFKALKDKGITILVGGPKKNSSARYFLRNTAEVLDFLKRVRDI
ncbi:MAG: trehalose-phosphatase [Candidatus Omnitrophica bacterium]|nr:trehalose-phosphatase [Candidatus Omnitrophota bacterium]